MEVIGPRFNTPWVGGTSIKHAKEPQQQDRNHITMQLRSGLVAALMLFLSFDDTLATPMINDDDGETTWVLDTHVSDEFDESALNRKWGQQLGNWKGTVSKYTKT